MKAHERASVLRRRVAEIKEAKKFEKHAEALEDKRQALESYRSKLQAAVESAAVLVKNGCLKSDALPDPQKLDEALESIVEAFTDDLGSITRGRNFTTLSGHLETITEELRGGTTRAWKEEVSTAPKINESLLSMIGQLRDQRTAVGELRIASAELADVSKTPPANQTEWTDYRKLKNFVKEKVAELNADHFPKSVLEFCIAAQSEGAQLSMLTEDVRAWLEENDMLDDVRYRFK